MKIKKLYLALMVFGVAFQAEARPVICEDKEKQIVAVLDIQGPIQKTKIERICLKRDEESDPSCNDYGSYTCPCIKEGTQKVVEELHWLVRGNIKTAAGILPLPVFKMTRDENAKRIYGLAEVMTRASSVKPKLYYFLSLSKSDVQNSQLKAGMGFVPDANIHHPGVLYADANCKY